MPDGVAARRRGGPDTLVVPSDTAARLPEAATSTRLIADWPRMWTPAWLAFLEPVGVVGEQQIATFARVRGVKPVSADDVPEALALLAPFRTLEHPIAVARPRPPRTFATTFAALIAARSINDLFLGTPATNRLWDEFHRAAIRAEREWPLRNGGVVEFAVFCRRGVIAVSVSSGPLPAVDPAWHLVRTSPRALRSSLQATVAEVIAAIEQLDGLAHGGMPEARPLLWPPGTPLQTSFAEVTPG